MESIDCAPFLHPTRAMRIRAVRAFTSSPSLAFARIVDYARVNAFSEGHRRAFASRASARDAAAAMIAYASESWRRGTPSDVPSSIEVAICHLEISRMTDTKDAMKRTSMLRR